MNDYYDVSIKEYRLKQIEECVAQAGGRYSITNPDAYIEANLIGFYNILVACRHMELIKNIRVELAALALFLDASPILFMFIRQMETRYYLN